MTDVNQVKTGKVTLNTADSEPIPTIQISYLGKPAEAALMMVAGFPARPLEKSLCLVINIGGQEENRIVIPLGTTKRKKGLKPGESVVENEKTGGFMYLRDDGTLEINIPKDLEQIVQAINIVASGDTNITTTKFTVTTPVSKLTGSLEVGDFLKVATAFGCNGAAPQTAYPLAAPATNLATCIALANSMRAALIANGIGT